jgi:hypothetical protein
MDVDLAMGLERGVLRHHGCTWAWRSLDRILPRTGGGEVGSSHTLENPMGQLKICWTPTLWFSAVYKPIEFPVQSSPKCTGIHGALECSVRSPKSCIEIWWRSALVGPRALTPQCTS